MKLASLGVVGAATFAFVQVLWTLGHTYGGLKGAWVMKTGLGIAFCFAVFAIVAGAASALQGSPGGLVRFVGAMLAGALVALVVALMIVGPGNLWPIVIVFDGAIIGGAILLGAAIGSAFRRTAR